MQTNKILEVTNGLQFSIFFNSVTVLFCIIQSFFLISSIISSHSSENLSDLTTNLAAFLNAQLQFTTLKKESLPHFSFIKHSHIHFSLFHLLHLQLYGMKYFLTHFFVITSQKR